MNRKSGKKLSLFDAFLFCCCDSGDRSSLANKANNKYGIKGYFNDCGFIYKGDKYRCYPSYKISWEDHSQFLLSKPTIKKLIANGDMDYRVWTQNLKEIHYAEDPLYSDKLNDIIERTGLYYLDLVAASKSEYIARE